MSSGLLLRQLLRDVKSQKVRTLLTTFGIVWGTTAVSLLLAFGQGLRGQVYRNTAGLGEYILIAWPSRTSIPYEGLGKGRALRLTEEDMDLIGARAQGLLGISGEYQSSLKLHYGTRTLAVDVSGVKPVFGELRNLIPQAGGRFLNALDERERRRVAFLGDELAKDVFGGTDAVGKTVRLGGSPFLVLGVLKHKDQDSDYSGRDKDKIFIPGSTFRALTGKEHVDNFIFKAERVSGTDRLKKEVLAILAKKHRFHPEDKEALAIWDTTEMFQFFETFMLGFQVFLGVVGSLTLVVGGIGVSNIMNVVVEERTREIGIKMALGARPSSVLAQFLAETFLMTLVGGVLGLGISALVCAVFPSLGLQEYVGLPRISPSVAGITAAILGAVGILAGYFPARDASRLDPVVAMKV